MYSFCHVFVLVHTIRDTLREKESGVTFRQLAYWAIDRGQGYILKIDFQRVQSRA